MVTFLAGLERAEVVQLDLVAEMKADNLGFEPPTTGALGPY
jgi:hypothetical protein